MIKNFKWLLLVSLSFVACNNDDETIVVSNSSDGLPLTAGSADFSKYVALGDSFAAGYSDGALFIAGQQGAYPNVLAQQFALVGGGTFTTPLMADNIGGFSVGGNQFPLTPVRLFLNACFLPQSVSGIASTILGQSIAANGPYNNVGVPGAKSIHLLSPTYGSAAGLATGTANPYYVRFAPNGTTSVLDYAKNQAPTFFSLWIGGGDVLGYAMSGGDGSSPITPAAGLPGVGFDGTYNYLVTSLTSTGAKGVIANIPYVNTLPFFTTIPVKPLAPNAMYVGENLPDKGETDCKKVYPVSVNDVATINSINGLLGTLKQILTALGEGDRV